MPCGIAVTLPVRRAMMVVMVATSGAIAAMFRVVPMVVHAVLQQMLTMVNDIS
jgi:hypothetical protein